MKKEIFMKFCPNCGAEVFEDAVVCVKCGRPLSGNAPAASQPPVVEEVQPSTLATIAKVFMIIGTVFMSLFTFCIALAWCLPMTISYCNKIKKGIPVSTGFKVCSLLFVNTIAGILMICDHK